MAGWTVAETWQGPRYSPVRDTISDLQAATATHVWSPIVCFAAGGLGTFCFAVFGLRRAVPGWGVAIFVLRPARVAWPFLFLLSEDERHEHLGRAPVRRVGLGELLGQVALLDGRAVDEVDPGKGHGDKP